MRKVVVADRIGEAGLAELRKAADLEVAVPGKVPLEKLLEELEGAHGLIVRSATKVTADLLAAAPVLEVVVRAGTGTDNIDVPAATRRGVVVMNTPGANAFAAAEHTLALMLALVRHVPAANRALLEGRWERDSFMGTELRGKTLGIVGLGRIGSHVGARARAFGMPVVAYDPFLDAEQIRAQGAEPLPFEKLLEGADVLTLHLPLGKETRHLVGAAELKRLKPGALLVNCARGGLVDESALLEALESGQLGGAALDVYETEPTPRPELVRHPRVVATPHLGASTREAQDAVGTQAVRQLLDALAGRGPDNAVNLPVTPQVLADLAPLLGLLQGLGRLSRLVGGGSPREARLEVAGSVGVGSPACLAFAAGFLAGPGRRVNLVNAGQVAEEQGFRVDLSALPAPADARFRVTATLRGAADEHVLLARLPAAGEPRLTGIDGLDLDARPTGWQAYLRYRDGEGTLGRLLARLEERGPRVRELRLGRNPAGSEAAALIAFAEPLQDPAVFDPLRSEAGVIALGALAG